ncbi:hypothetical protein [Thermomonospora cellulosilytica]|uniref:Uncharacterized protein n=1 Tax=Thermomonospora cellulosilytica TaxID=1411118 RepID=A0A7W3MZP7_9ACTN|nr:hypothetical protein [Thermomonospora cellulosilytica]MBA9004872.1 hypothetical protein [Thermomonospora cellulosilytica]
MAGSGYETALAEYADIEERLRDPAVLRRFRLARRLRRELAALEALSFDGTDGARDRFDPYDVVIRIDGRGALASWLLRACERGARRRGWRVEHFTGPTPPVDLAVCAGEDGPGAWSVFKHRTGLHRDAATGETVRVLVLPDSGEPVDPAALPGDPADWSISRFCTRDGVDRIGVTHLPSGLRGWGYSADSRHTARDNALRTVRALLLAEGLDPTEPAYRFVHPDLVPVRAHDLRTGRAIGHRDPLDGPDLPQHASDG